MGMRIIGILLLTLLLSACTKLSFLAVNAGAGGAYTVEKDLPYGPEARQKLDIYTPKTGEAPHKVVVFFYGGRWEGGAKADYKFVAADFAERGYVVVIPDYRLYPQVKFPTFVEDGAAAVAWTIDRVALYGGDPKAINIAGHSAGAHIGSLIVSDERYLKALNKDAHNIKSFVGLAGPYSFTPDEADLMDMFGPPANYPNMQASTFIDGREPPMLLLYGADDTIVKSINHERMVKAGEAKGGNITAKIYPGLTHISILGALSWYNPRKASVLQDMDAFFSSHDASP